jgi:hypothetical protein
VAGVIEASEEEILGFSRFLEGKYITRVFREGGTVYLAFSMNRSLYATENAREVSHVYLTNKGQVSVFITEADYS